MKFLLVLMSRIFLSFFVQGFSIGKFSISEVNYCGNGVIGEDEECDQLDFNNESCLSRGYDFGDLNCTIECTFDESFCRINGTRDLSQGFSGGSSESSNGQRIIRECNDEKDNDLDGRIDLIDFGCSNILDNSEKEIICDSEWIFEDWKECIENIQFRLVVDINHCKSEYIKNETQQCFSVQENKSGYLDLTIISVLTFISLMIIYLRKRN